MGWQEKADAEDRGAYNEALDAFREGERAQGSHMPGHESYVIECYLACLCVLALAYFRSEHCADAEPVAPPSNPEGT